jgi:transketolase
MPLSPDETRTLQAKARELRCLMVDVTTWAGGAHIGGSLSSADIFTALYYRYLNVRPEEPQWPDRDRFILSKGHGGVGLASVLADRGYFPKDLLHEFNHFKSPFGMHLDGNKVPGVDASTGSLGHGLSMAVGMAMGARFQGQSWLTYCMLGDGECNEGSVWEAAMAASHFKVTNLITIVDRNRFMIDGATEDVMSLEPLADKWRAFGFEVKEIDGHDFAQIGAAIEDARARAARPAAGTARPSGPVGPAALPAAKPTVIIAHTVKGKGVDFMENDVKWHYGSLDSELAAKAKASIERAA